MSTQSPQPTETESIEQRALNEMLETKASRRNVLRGIGATGTAAIGATASTGAVGAQEEEEAAEDTANATMNVTSPSLAKYGMAADVAQSLTDRLFGGGDPEELPEDEIELHGDASYQMQGIENYYVMVDDNLERTMGVATIDARHAIASAWEDGQDSATAYSNAMEAIREYYALHEENHLKVFQNEMLQLSILGEKVAENNDIRSSFLHATVEPVEGGTGTDYDTMLIRKEDDDADLDVHTFTLQNGDEIDIEMPKMECRVHDSDSTKDPDIGTTDRYPINQELLDSWEDVGDEDWLVWEDSDGNQYDSVMDFVLFDIDDPANEGETLRESIVLFQMRQWMDRYQEIKNQSDSATGRFDEDMVDDMFELMDDGILDPSEVRSAEGMRQHLSGDSEVSSDSYKLALYNQLDLGQADLSEISHMEITYSGYTDNEVTYQNENRVLTPTDEVEDRKYAGMLYADETPGDGFQSGHHYAIGGYSVYALRRDSVEIATYDSESFEEGSSVSIDSATSLESYDISSDGETIFVFDHGTDCVTSINRTDMSVNWTSDEVGAYSEIVVDPNDEEVYASGNNGGIYVLDFESGEQINQFDPNYTDNLTVGSSGNFYATSGLDLYVGSDLESLESQSVSTTIEDTGQPIFGASNDGSVLFVENDSGNLVAIDTSSFEEMWSYSFVYGDPFSFAHIDDETIVALSDNGSMASIEISSGSVDWEERPAQGTLGDLYLTQGGENIIYASSNTVFAVDPSDGSVNWNETISGWDEIAVAIPDVPEKDITANVGECMFYDAVNSEEIDLIDGIFTIDSMQNTEGEEIEEPQEWDGGPDYETIDNEKFVEYVEQQTEIIETIENGGDEPDSDDINITFPEYPGPDIPDFGDSGGGAIVGVILVGLVVVSVAWSVLTEFIPFLGK